MREVAELRTARVRRELPQGQVSQLQAQSRPAMLLLQGEPAGGLHAGVQREEAVLVWEALQQAASVRQPQVQG